LDVSNSVTLDAIYDRISVRSLKGNLL